MKKKKMIELMAENYTADELLKWAEMYRDLYGELGGIEFGCASDSLLREAIKKVNEEDEAN